MKKKIVLEMTGRWMQTAREFRDIDGENLYCLGGEWDPVVVEIDEEEWENLKTMQETGERFYQSVLNLKNRQREKKKV